MEFRKERSGNHYFGDTRVENIFINEYMVSAPGDYVKVYLLASMYVEIALPVSNEILARELKLSVEEVHQAWSYWEKMRVVRKEYRSGEDKLCYDVEFANLREAVFGGGRKKQVKETPMPSNARKLVDDEGLRALYARIERITGRLLTGKEPAAILSWMDDYSVGPDLIAYAYTFCKEQRRSDKHNYVGAVVKDWAGRGLRTPEQVEDYLDETDNRHFQYKRVLKALGFTRNATEEERRLMDSWFDDLGFGIDKVLEACKQTTGISNPNFKYLNTILNRWAGTVPAEKKAEENPLQMVTRQFREKLERKTQEAAARRKETFASIPRIREIEEELRQLGGQIAQASFSVDPADRKKVRAFQAQTQSLLEEKAQLLSKNNLASNYLDIWYDCPDCKDSGTQDTGLYCHCFKAALEAAEKSV